MTETRRLRITADVSTCAGVRQCVLSDPTVFAHDDQYLVVVLQSEVDELKARLKSEGPTA